jgi:hypothetical protein
MDVRPEIDQLVREIERYLAVVELFRQEGHEPAWSSEVPINDLREGGSRCTA